MVLGLNLLFEIFKILFLNIFGDLGLFEKIMWSGKENVDLFLLSEVELVYMIFLFIFFSIS